jgi:hypothetical protein
METSTDGVRDRTLQFLEDHREDEELCFRVWSYVAVGWDRMWSFPGMPRWLKYKWWPEGLKED